MKGGGKDGSVWERPAVSMAMTAGAIGYLAGQRGMFPLASEPRRTGGEVGPSDHSLNRNAPCVVEGVGLARGDTGHLMPRENIVPQSEVIRAILLEDSLDDTCPDWQRPSSTTEHGWTGAPAAGAATAHPKRRHVGRLDRVASSL